MASHMSKSHLYDLWSHRNVLCSRASWAEDTERELLEREADLLATQVGRMLGRVPRNDDEFLSLIRDFS